jgi:predicted nucleic acid-binding protein
MEVVIDSNVLFRTLISGGEIIYLFFNRTLKIFAPKKLKEELIKNKIEILEKSKFSSKEFDELISTISKIIEFVSRKKYESFLPKARKLLAKHRKDEDFVALALYKNIKIWTYEKLLFNLGFGISTKQISEKLK